MRCKILQGLLVKKSDGFTLLEVMIALVILSVGLLGLAALQLVAIKGNSFSSEMTTATMIAQERAEMLKNRPYTDLDLVQGTHNAVGSSKGVQYAITWEVTDNTPATDMKLIELSVSWQSARQGQASAATAVTARLQTIVRNL